MKSLELSAKINDMRREIARNAASELLTSLSNPYFDTRPEERHLLAARIILGASLLMNGEPR